MWTINTRQKQRRECAKVSRIDDANGHEEILRRKYYYRQKYLCPWYRKGLL